MSDSRVVVVFCVIVFAASWVLQLGAIQTAGDLESSAAEPWLIGAMLTPALTILVIAGRHKPTRARLKWKFTRRMFGLLPVAVLVPTIIAFAVVAFVIRFGWGTSGWFTFSPSGVDISGGPWLLGRGLEGWPLFVANVFVTGVAYSLFNGIVAAGEELGWRGYLQGALSSRYGNVRAILLLGVLWSMWHLPGQLAGYNFPEHPVMGALILSPIELVGVSFFLGWLTIKSASFWPAAVAHGAGNSIQEGVVSNLTMNGSRLPEDLCTVAITVLVGLVFWALIGAARQKQVVSPLRGDN